MGQGTEIEAVESEILGKITCGSCAAAKLLIWIFDSNYSIDKISSTADTKTADEKPVKYQVRCDYFRTAIPHPDRLTICGGYKKK
jgi:hypothetical protein